MPKTAINADGTKRCCGCKQVLSVDAFYSGSNRSIRRSRCKECEKAARKKVHPSVARSYSVVSKYGVTQNELRGLFEKQGCGCAICEKPLIFKESHNNWDVDHDHLSGEVRGILCKKCNRGIGHFADSVTQLSKAIDYLKSPPFKKDHSAN